MDERLQIAIRVIREADNVWALSAHLNETLDVGIQHPPPDVEVSNAIADSVLRRVSQMDWRQPTFFCHHYGTDECPSMLAGARLTNCPLRRSCRAFALERTDIF